MIARRLHVLVIDETGPRPLRVILTEIVAVMVEYFDGNKSKTAKRLEVSRNTIYRLLGNKRRKIG